MMAGEKALVVRNAEHGDIGLDHGVVQKQGVLLVESCRALIGRKRAPLC